MMKQGTALSDWYVTKELPPPKDSNLDLLCFTFSKQYVIKKSSDAHLDATRMMQKDFDHTKTSWDRKFTHWAFIRKPDLREKIYPSERTKL